MAKLLSSNHKLLGILAVKAVLCQHGEDPGERVFHSWVVLTGREARRLAVQV
jgi:hypothetical protein